MIWPLAGCGNSPKWAGDDVVVLVAGAGGDGPWYSGIRDGLREEGQYDRRLYTYRWGAPLPLFVFNLQDRGVHGRAEKDLVKRLVEWRTLHPDGRIQLVGHSAGCGVILGALRRLDEVEPRVAVERVVLLAPSVSAGYDPGPSMRHVLGQVHVFHSDRDTVHLKWRANTFGTYDNVKTTAAGNAGFVAAGLPEELKAKLIQHPFNPAWEDLGHDGGHWGSVEERFVAEVLRPLLH